jgi:hypothetical protein
VPVSAASAVRSPSASAATPPLTTMIAATSPTATTEPDRFRRGRRGPGSNTTIDMLPSVREGARSRIRTEYECLAAWGRSVRSTAMHKLLAVVLAVLLPLGVAACGDDKEGNADALADNCQTALDDAAADQPGVPTEDICRCYGDKAAEEYSTDELNELLKKGNEEKGQEALAPILLDCADQNGVDLTDTGSSTPTDDGTSGTDVDEAS